MAKLGRPSIKHDEHLALLIKIDMIRHKISNRDLSKDLGKHQNTIHNWLERYMDRERFEIMSAAIKRIAKKKQG